MNWRELAFELDLDALARQLVLNSTVQSSQNNELKLAFLPELEVLLKPQVEQQIKTALESKLGVSLKIEFISQPLLDGETPQAFKQRKQEQERQDVIRQIKVDPVVVKLKTLFGAELIEPSVSKQIKD